MINEKLPGKWKTFVGFNIAFFVLFLLAIIVGTAAMIALLTISKLPPVQASGGDVVNQLIGISFRVFISIVLVILAILSDMNIILNGAILLIFGIISIINISIFKAANKNWCSILSIIAGSIGGLTAFANGMAFLAVLIIIIMGILILVIA